MKISLTGTAKKILIVDDNEVILAALSMKLKSHGYKVFTATDGAAVLADIRDQRPDLILLDINFPPDVAHGGGMNWDGFGILEWLRRLQEARDIPVIIITGENATSYREQAEQAGAVGFFQKPIDNNQLTQFIMELFHGPLK